MILNNDYNVQNWRDGYFAEWNGDNEEYSQNQKVVIVKEMTEAWKRR